MTQEQGYNTLSEAEKRVIIEKGTEMPFTGAYEDHAVVGTYACRRCNAPLYASKDKFASDCGWPAFDDEIAGAVLRFPDADGRRTEIVCANCKGHLGHVFVGEKLTEKNTRHCVNSIALQFYKAGEQLPATLQGKAAEIAYLASGCFWGTEFHLQKMKGVISTSVGYTGGTVECPSYEHVCTGETGHAEAVKVLFDPEVVSYEAVLKLFFETHDPTQPGGQGPDIGTQYRSEIFYTTDAQKETAKQLIAVLNKKGYRAVTKITAATAFYEAEDYHQNYYNRKGQKPYCHIYKQKF